MACGAANRSRHELGDRATGGRADTASDTGDCRLVIPSAARDLLLIPRSAPHSEDTSMFIESSSSDLLTVLSIAGATASVVVLIYRLGVWRQKMADLEQNVAGEVARQGADTARSFARLDERLSSIDRFVAMATEQRVAVERWQARVDTTLVSIETRLVRLERGSDRPVAA